MVFLFIIFGCSSSSVDNMDVNSIKEKTKDLKKEDLEEWDVTKSAKSCINLLPNDLVWRFRTGNYVSFTLGTKTVPFAGTT